MRRRERRLREIDARRHSFYRVRHFHRGRANVRAADLARAGRVQAVADYARAAWRVRRSPACSTCAAASSPQSTCASGSRRTDAKAAPRLWRSASKPEASRSASWSMRWAKCSISPTSNASPIRSISAAASPHCRTAFFDSKASCWLCSTLTAFSTYAASRCAAC